MAATQLSDGNPDGVQLGQSATDKVGLYGATPIAQRSSSAMGTVTVTPTTTGVGFASIAQMQSFVAKFNELAATLVAIGAHKGS